MKKHLRIDCTQGLSLTIEAANTTGNEAVIGVEDDNKIILSSSSRKVVSDEEASTMVYNSDSNPVKAPISDEPQDNV